MKKIFLLILFILTFSNVFPQGIYFSSPTSDSVFYSDTDGYIAIPYHMYAMASLVVGEYDARLIYPNGDKTNWMMNQTAGWYVTKAGVYQIEGKAWAYDFVLGGSWKWVYRQAFSFLCVDNIAPSIPLSIASTSQNNHPKVTWTANSEHDMSYYEIYKKKNSSVYTYYDQTVNNYYVDLSEFLYKGGLNKTYIYYKIKAVDVNANKSDLSSSTHAVVNGPIEKGTMLNEESTLNVFKLFENYPNPFNPSTTINYQIPKGSYVTLKVFNTLGKEIAELVNGFEESGKYSIIFDASNLPSGMYFYKLQAGTFTDVKKMLLTK